MLSDNLHLNSAKKQLLVASPDLFIVNPKDNL